MIPPCAFFVLGLLFCKELGAFWCQLCLRLLSSLVRSILWVAFACRFTVWCLSEGREKCLGLARDYCTWDYRIRRNFVLDFGNRFASVSRSFSFLSLFSPLGFWPTLTGPRHKHFLKQVPPLWVSSSEMEFVSFNPASAHMIWR